MSPSHSEVFKTDLAPPARRIAWWNDLAVATFGDISINPTREGFRAQMQRTRLGELMLATMTSSPASVQGGQSHTHQGWFLLLNKQGVSRCQQAGTTAVLEPGELTLLNSAEQYVIDFSQSNQTTVLYLPTLPDHLKPETHLAKKHTAQESALLASFMQRLSELAEGDVESLSMTRLALELMTLTWPARRTETRQSMEKWRQRVMERVQRRLDEPALDAEMLAQDLGISPRFVHLVFASMGETPAQYILEQRLIRAEALLQQRAHSITAVALQTGFNDLSHFCRCFKRRYGQSARQFRLVQ